MLAFDKITGTGEVAPRRGPGLEGGKLEFLPTVEEG